MILLLSLAAWGAPDARVLSDYTFLRPTVVDSPLPTTHLGFRQGAAWLQVPDLVFPGYRTPIDLQLLGLTEGLDAQVGVSERSAVFADVTSTVVAGTNADSAFFQGARGAVVWRAGARTALLSKERWTLGGRLMVSGLTGAVAEPANLVQALLDEREETLREVIRGKALNYVLSEESSKQGGGGLSVAWTPHPRVGVHASTRVLVGPTTIGEFNGRKYVYRRRTADSWSTGAAFCWSPFEAPFAAQLEVRNRIDHNRIDAVKGQVHGSLGGYFTGRDDLQLGLVVASRYRRSDTPEQYLAGEAVARYYF